MMKEEEKMAYLVITKKFCVGTDCKFCTEFLDYFFLNNIYLVF